LALPSELGLITGQEATVEIGGAGSAGYLWSLEVGEDSGAIDASVGPKQPLPPSRSEPYGGSWPQVLVVRALKPGRATVHLELARPGQTPLIIHDIVIRVSE